MQKGVSARDMSLSMGQSENYINRIENRKALPSMTSFFYICEYLEIEPRDFFDWDNACPRLADRFAGTLKNLDESDLEHLLALSEKLGRKCS